MLWFTLIFELSSLGTGAICGKTKTKVTLGTTQFVCQERCKERSCDPRTGRCLQGCVPGYFNSWCGSACPNGTYGAGCLALCPATCLPPTACHHVTGACLQGCIAGFTGVKCDQTCPAMKYGEACIKNCSEGCLNHLCSPNSGRCDTCVSGWWGPHCDIQKHIDGEDDEKEDKTATQVTKAQIINAVIGLIFLGLLMWCILGCNAYYQDKRSLEIFSRSGRIPYRMKKPPYFYGSFAIPRRNRKRLSLKPLGQRPVGARVYKSKYSKAKYNKQYETQIRHEKQLEDYYQRINYSVPFRSFIEIGQHDSQGKDKGKNETHNGIHRMVSSRDCLVTISGDSSTVKDPMNRDISTSTSKSITHIASKQNETNHPSLGKLRKPTSRVRPAWAIKRAPYYALPSDAYTPSGSYTVTVSKTIDTEQSKCTKTEDDPISHILEPGDFESMSLCGDYNTKPVNDGTTRTTDTQNTPTHSISKIDNRGVAPGTDQLKRSWISKGIARLSDVISRFRAYTNNRTISEGVQLSTKEIFPEPGHTSDSRTHSSKTQHSSASTREKSTMSENSAETTKVILNPAPMTLLELSRMKQSGSSTPQHPANMITDNKSQSQVAGPGSEQESKISSNIQSKTSQILDSGSGNQTAQRAGQL